MSALSPLPPDATASGRPLLAFGVLAFAISWLGFLPAVMTGGETTPAVIGGYLVGAFGPTVAALVATYWDAGERGVRTLLSRLTIWRVPLRWWLVALLLPAGLKLGTLGVLVLAGNPLPTVTLDPLPFVLATMVIGGLIPGAIGEELGWRGVALPRLVARYGLAAASVVLGVVWALWHLPTLYVSFTAQASLPPGWLLLEITAASVLFTWIVANTDWSVLVAIGFHAANNALTPVLYPAIANAGYLTTFGVATALVYATVALVLLVVLRQSDTATAQNSAAPESVP